MRCADLAELISAYADGQTVPAQTEFVEAHLLSCPRCQAVLRRHQQTRRLLHFSMHDAWTPPDMRLRVAHAYNRRRANRRPVLLGGAMAGAAAVLLTLGLLGAHLAGPQAARPAGLGSTSRPVMLADNAAPASCKTCTPAAPRRAALSPIVLANLAIEKMNQSEVVDPALFPPLPADWPQAPDATTLAKGGEPHPANSAYKLRIQPL
jgi:predicted anti-sigma-YlaC factor YlaD